MGKLITFLLVVIVVVAIILYLSGKGFGKGNGNGNTKGDGNNKIVETQIETVVDDETVKETQLTTQEVSTDEGSAVALEEKNGTKIEITISENEYIYEEQKYNIDDITQKVKEIKENENDFYVYLIDEMASKKAYDELIESLEGLDVVYVNENE